MTQRVEDVLQAGCDACRRHAWREAFDLLKAADASGALAPEDLERLADAAWWTGRLADCIAARDRAYAGYIESGNPRRAALMAGEQARNYFQKGDASVAMAWLKRANRLLQQEPESLEHGYLMRINAVVAIEDKKPREGADAGPASLRHRRALP
ncbi:MAG: hypothetical protein QN131_11035 [Armatimonadota bacterium]|nr:hypothetical protein [Armatimonadota bacterium]MDR7550452.1 hypothetical protein [Armatimonadota bacterium]